MPRKSPGAKAKGLGARLRSCRENAGLNLRDAAEAIDWDKSMLSRLETGKRNMSVEEVAQLLGVYRVRGQQRDDLLAIARAMDEPGWWEQSVPELPAGLATLADFESEAVRIADWAPLLIPGLLQTSAFSRAWLGSVGVAESVIDSRVRARARRQRILAGEVQYVAYVGEAALHTAVGGGVTAAAQLAHLREVSRWPNVSVRIVPIGSVPPRAQLGAFIALEFADSPTVVHVELVRSSVFMDEDRQTDPYIGTLTAVDSVALSETESAGLITRYQARWKDSAQRIELA
ncbi:transcriptional regulator [Amycolatopsis antarctica]|uniref:Transcriptional regulator n=1 Tax=Amycolatopsis antarctica TaxID=1854586 RepID=A0A263D292_9PSEU|nr:helix-turn-helix transcriptional regulator [Amycolatopsis antarctica]OZM72580.1 transcriptional regulator [Amycolatopsis antarctica]